MLCVLYDNYAAFIGSFLVVYFFVCSFDDTFRSEGEVEEDATLSCGCNHPFHFTFMSSKVGIGSKWTTAEDAELSHVVAQLLSRDSGRERDRDKETKRGAADKQAPTGQVASHIWAEVANKISGNRSAKQCRERWSNHLDPHLTWTPWTAEEDATLTRLHGVHGNHWTILARHMPGRSENAIKNRWNAAARRQQRQARNRSLSARNHISTHRRGDDKINTSIESANMSSVQSKTDALKEKADLKISPSRANQLLDISGSNSSSSSVSVGNDNKTIGTWPIMRDPEQEPETPPKRNGTVKMQFTAEDVRNLQIAESYLNAVYLSLQGPHGSGSRTGPLDPTSDIVSQLVAFMEEQAHSKATSSSLPTQAVPLDMSDIDSASLRPGVFPHLRVQKRDRGTDSAMNAIDASAHIVTGSVADSGPPASESRSSNSSDSGNGSGNGSGSGTGSGSGSGSIGLKSWGLGSLSSSNNSFLREFFKSPLLSQKEIVADGGFEIRDNLPVDSPVLLSPPLSMQSSQKSDCINPFAIGSNSLCSTPVEGVDQSAMLLSDSAKDSNNSMSGLSKFTFGSMHSSLNSSTENLHALADATLRASRQSASLQQQDGKELNATVNTSEKTGLKDLNSDQGKLSSGIWLGRSLTPSPTSDRMS